MVFHLDLCPPNQLLRAWLNEWDLRGPFPIVVLCGARSDAEQLIEYAKGRKQLPDGSWIIVDHTQIVTNAQTAKTSAHGHNAAIDVAPVRDTYRGGGVKLIYQRDQKTEDPTAFAEAVRRYDVMIASAQTAGLRSGKDFPFPDWDHVEDPQWTKLPLAPGVAA